MGGSLENFILDRNFQSRSKSRILLIFGPSGKGLLRKVCGNSAEIRGNFQEIRSIASGKVRMACLQNETAPEKKCNPYEKGFEKREERPEERSETCPKSV